VIATLANYEENDELLNFWNMNHDIATFPSSPLHLVTPARFAQDPTLDTIAILRQNKGTGNMPLIQERDFRDPSAKNSSSYRYNSDSLRISFLADQMSRTVNKKEEHEEVLRGGRQGAQRFPCVAILRAQNPTLSLPSPSSGRDV
jgi:hypothetical protein